MEPLRKNPDTGIQQKKGFAFESKTFFYFKNFNYHIKRSLIFDQVELLCGIIRLDFFSEFLFVCEFTAETVVVGVVTVLIVESADCANETAAKTNNPAIIFRTIIGAPVKSFLL